MQNTPVFNQSGFVVAADSDGTFFQDIENYLRVAVYYRVFVVFSLWNGAVMPSNPLIGLIVDPVKLQSYIDVVLTPLARVALKFPRFGAFEIMNEPEGSIQIAPSSEPCFDTMPLNNSGAGWTGCNLQMSNMQQFINLQAAAVHRVSRQLLVTVGSWTEKAQTNSFGFRNYYEAQCLIKAGGQSLGVLDLNQMHTYGTPAYDSTAPFVDNHTAASYNCSLPLIIGEFSQVSGNGMSSAQQYQYTFSHGYSGAWGWQGLFRNRLI